MRAAARRFRTSLLTVQRWVERAEGYELDEVDWTDRSSAPRRTRHTPVVLEDEVLRLRTMLHESVLGEYGAAAIRRSLLADPAQAARVPSLRTIGRILERRGVLDGQRRVRRPAPPRGWYLPDLAAHETELDSYDVVEGLHLRGGIDIEVLTGVSLHGGLVVAWPGPPVNSRTTVDRLLEHWRSVGRPGYAQFDNDTRFHGSHAYPDILGPVVRLCLALSVVPVFAPPREHGFQAAVEQFNGRWQAKVWDRTWTDTIDDLVAVSDRYVAAHRARYAVRIERAPERRPLPGILPSPQPPTGRMVFLRRTTDDGHATVLGRPYEVDIHWPHRLVRAELDFDAASLSFYALRRREPADQPLLAVHPYRPVTKHVYPTRRK